MEEIPSSTPRSLPPPQTATTTSSSLQPPPTTSSFQNPPSQKPSTPLQFQQSSDSQTSVNVQSDSYSFDGQQSQCRVGSPSPSPSSITCQSPWYSSETQGQPIPSLQPETSHQSFARQQHSPQSSTQPSFNLLGKRSIQDLVNQIDPSGKLDPELEDVLLGIADDFLESVSTIACSLAKHRKSTTIEAKDILLALERNWNITLPGFGGDEIRAREEAVKDSNKEPANPKS